MSEPYPLKALLLLHDDALDAAKHAHAEALNPLRRRAFRHAEPNKRSTRIT